MPSDTTALQTPPRPRLPALAGRLRARLPHRRTRLKWLHWTTLPFLVWFVLVTPSDVLSFGQWAFEIHSVFGLIFVSLALAWTAGHLRRGLASRPGPKLRGWERVLHPVLHKTLIWGLFGVAFTGFALGLTSATLLWAGGIVPIAPPMGWPRLNDLAGTVHIYEFYALTGLVAVHAAFHIWRHVRLRDNALRIMTPKVLHRFL